MQSECSSSTTQFGSVPFNVGQLRLGFNSSSVLFHSIIITVKEAVSPAITCTHNLYVTLLGRSLIGEEKMYMQGFPRSFLMPGLNQRQINALAGNTMTVPVMASFLFCFVLNVDFKSCSANPAAGQHNVKEKIVIGDAFAVTNANNVDMTGNTDRQGKAWLAKLPVRNKKRPLS